MYKEQHVTLTTEIYQFIQQTLCGGQSLAGWRSKINSTQRYHISATNI